MTITRSSVALSIIGAALAGSLITAPAMASALPTEDSPGWSCVDSGNHICGPDSDDYGHTPGCYDDGGVLVAAWPCYVVTNADGSADIYTPDAR